MKIIKYADVTPTHFDNDQAKGVTGRVVVGPILLIYIPALHRLRQ